MQIGCGTGLPGLVAALAGCEHVTFSDDARKTDVLETMRRVVALNGISKDSASVTGLTWGEFDDTTAQLPPFNLILAADCLYDVSGERTVNIFA